MKPTATSLQGPCADYETLRQRYRPTKLRFVLLGESPPDPAPRGVRFFYCPEFRFPDTLYHAVVDALYDWPNDYRNKTKYLDRLMADGWWLIDAVAQPISRLASDDKKRAAIRAAGPEVIARLSTGDAHPSEGVVICLRRVFEELSNQLLEAGIWILHRQPLPFPNRPARRRKFVAELRSIARSRSQ